jgi:hypothetical protein
MKLDMKSKQKMKEKEVGENIQKGNFFFFCLNE